MVHAVGSASEQLSGMVWKTTGFESEGMCVLVLGPTCVEQECREVKSFRRPTAYQEKLGLEAGVALSPKGT